MKAGGLCGIQLMFAVLLSLGSSWGIYGNLSYSYGAYVV